MAIPVKRLPEEVTQAHKRHAPHARAERRERDEATRRVSRWASEKRRHGPHQSGEPANQDRRQAVASKELLDLEQSSSR